MDLNLIRRMAGIPTENIQTVTATNTVANEFRKLAGLNPLPIKEEPKEEMTDDETVDEVPTEEMPSEETTEELPEIVKQIASKAEGLEGDELVDLIKQVYDAGVQDGMSQAEEIKEKE